MSPTDPTTLRAFLSEDHTRLDAMLDAFRQAVREEEEQPTLDARWAEYEEHLLTHLDAEETCLLPGLAKHDPAAAARIRHDHETLRRVLAAIGIGLDLHVVRDDQMTELARRLGAHAKMEDETLYAWADGALSPSLLESLYRRLRAAWDRVGSRATSAARADDSSSCKPCVATGNAKPV